MKRITTSRQMKESDQAAIEIMGIPSCVLMERAALAVKDTLLEEGFDLSRVLVLCGGGNNGGDGIAVARLLHLEGYEAAVCMTGNPAHRSEENKKQKKIAENYGTTFVNNPELSEYTTIVDSVFGIGLSRNLSEEYRKLFQKINETKAKVLAVDIPSGIDADTGRVMGGAVRADVTVTFAFAKPGLLLYPGAAYAGKVKVCDIGIYEHEKVCYHPEIFTLEESDWKLLPKRDPSGNKGTFGKVLLIAGSYGMEGAAYLSAFSCFRTGAGMVKVFTAWPNREILLRQLPEVMISCYEEGKLDRELLEKDMQWADVIGIGPGLGQSRTALEILEYVAENSRKPLVIDADGLNLIGSHSGILEQIKCPCILTPHMGEMSRLSGQTVKEIAEDRIKAAGDYAESHHVICVLKDARTVTAFDKNHFVINRTGNSGMATAGSGDVLTGMILGLLAAGMKSETAACFGVWIHGKAGDAAGEELGEASVTAEDIIAAIPAVLRQKDRPPKK
ncbi:MAG: NAD(P)H-hydrate dehydratase [Ruminococcus sp.]